MNFTLASSLFPSVHYIGVFPVAIEAIKAQQKMDALKAKHAQIEARLERIEAALRRK